MLSSAARAETEVNPFWGLVRGMLLARSLVYTFPAKLKNCKASGDYVADPYVDFLSIKALLNDGTNRRIVSTVMATATAFSNQLSASVMSDVEDMSELYHLSPISPDPSYAYITEVASSLRRRGLVGAFGDTVPYVGALLSSIKGVIKGYRYPDVTSYTAGMLDYYDMSASHTAAPDETDDDNDSSIQVIPASVFDNEKKGSSSNGDYRVKLEEWSFLSKPLPLTLISDDMTAQSVLDDLTFRFPYMHEANNYIAGMIAIRKHYSAPVDFGSILLVGPPGIGKTHYARHISTMLGSVLHIVSAGGLRDNDTMRITGSTRGYADARPGLWAFAMRDAKTANPIVVVDEIDKCGSAISGALLAYTEKETAKSYRDAFFEENADVSRMSFIMTANDIRLVDPVLKSRNRVFTVRPPTTDEFSTIIGDVVVDVLKENSVPETEYDNDRRLLFGQGIEDVVSVYEKTRSIRSAKRHIFTKIMSAIAPECQFIEDEGENARGIGFH